MRSFRFVAKALYVLQFTLFGVLTRGLPHPRDLPAFLLGTVGSAALWALVWSFRRRRTVRVAASLLPALLLTADAWVVRYYGTTLDRQVVASALHSWSDVRPVVVRVLPWEILACLSLSVVEYSGMSIDLVTSGHGVRARLALASVAVAFVLFVPREGSGPDLQAFRAVLALTGSHAAMAATRAEVPVLPSSRRELPNVLVILTESVRDESYCDEPRAGCPFTPELDRVLPDRFPLREMRSVASYTAVSAAALFTGHTQIGTPTELSGSPTLFDYVRAIRAGDQRVTVAYWSAQAASVLGAGVRDSVDSWITLETLLGREVSDEDDVVELGMDQKLAERFLREIPRLPHPVFVVLHFLGTHAPYFVDDARAPFRPYSHVAAWSSLAELQNAYQDAVVAQDHEIAACVRAFIQSSQGSPWLAFFTSDHGEAFGEHKAIHHGQNLYDEQIHVPAWIATGGGALDEAERARLASRRDDYLTHLDVLPTLLEAMGAWRGLGMGRLRSRLRGRSLLEVELPQRPVPITNCTDLFPCPLNTWGVLSGDHVLEAQPWDDDWNCVDLRAATEHVGGAECDLLRRSSTDYFPTLPNGRSNGPPSRPPPENPPPP